MPTDTALMSRNDSRSVGKREGTVLPYRQKIALVILSLGNTNLQLGVYEARWFWISVWRHGHRRFGGRRCFQEQAEGHHVDIAPLAEIRYRRNQNAGLA